MSTWPSGAIARATVNGEPNVLAMRANDGHWYSQHGLNWRDEQVTDARPLVVLDPAERPNLMFPVAAMLRDQSLARGATWRVKKSGRSTRYCIDCLSVEPTLRRPS